MKLSFYLPLYKVVKQGLSSPTFVAWEQEKKSFIFVRLLSITDWAYQPFYTFTMDRNRTERIFFIQVESHFLIP